MTLRAFTPIVLLVAVAILSILAAIVFPTFAQVRERARQTGCLSKSRASAPTAAFSTFPSEARSRSGIGAAR